MNVGDIVGFLEDQKLVRAAHRQAELSLYAPVTDIRSYEAAVTGSMSWLSVAALQAPGERIARYRGTLLITPPLASVPSAHEVGVVFAECDDPKLAFTLAARRFWPGVDQTRWPSDWETSTEAKGVVRGENCRFDADAVIGPNTVIANTSVCERVQIGANCSIGLSGFGFATDADGVHHRFPHVGRVVIGDDVEIGSNVTIDRGALGDTIIRCGAKIDNHVHIAHNADIGERVIIVAGAMIGGSVKVGPDAFIALGAVVRNKATIGAGAVVGMGAVVTKDVAPGHVVVGNPARTIRVKGE